MIGSRFRADQRKDFIAQRKLNLWHLLPGAVPTATSLDGCNGQSDLWGKAGLSTVGSHDIDIKLPRQPEQLTLAEGNSTKNPFCEDSNCH